MVDGRHAEDNSLPRPSVRPPKAATAPLCPAEQLVEREAVVAASRLGSEAVAAHSLPASWQFCSVAPSKIDGGVHPLTVIAEDFRQLLERVLGTRREVTRFPLRALACHWDSPLQARQQETAAPLTIIRMRVHPW